MATKVDSLIVEIKAETKGLRKGLNDLDNKLGKVNKTAVASGAIFKKLGGLFAVLGLAKIAGDVVRTVKSFEDLEATLQANTGNAAETAKALKMIEEFTSTTTFQIEEVTGAFIELKRKGISATRGEMEGLGKVAAANNVSIQRIAEGVTRAATTSIEQLQMMGFQGKTSGDMITLSYGEGADKIERTFKKTSANVMGFVAAIGDAKFDSAISDRANTVTGAFSNMSDNVGFFAKAIGEGGLKPALVSFARNMSRILAAAKPAAHVIGMVLAKAFFVLEKVMNASQRTMVIAGSVLAIYAAPAVWAALSGAVLALGKSLLIATGSVLKFTVALLTNPFTYVVLGLAAIVAGMVLLAKNWDNVVMFFENTMKVRVPNAIDKLKMAFVGMKISIIEVMNDLLKKLANKVNKLIEIYNKVNIGLEDIDPVSFTIPTDELEDDREQLKAAIAERLKLLKEYKKGEFDILGDVKGMLPTMPEMPDMESIISGDPDASSFDPKNFDFTAVDDGTAKIQSMTEAFNEMKPAIMETTNAFTKDFTDALLSGENAMDSFKDFAKNMVSQIIASFMQMMVIKPIMDAIMGSFGMPTTGMAGGGTVQKGQPVLVGERGAEMFVPNTGGKIVNNQNMNNMGGGGTTVINQSINFATGIVPTVRAEVMKMMPQIAETTKGAVAEASLRGGSFRKALQGG